MPLRFIKEQAKFADADSSVMAAITSGAASGMANQQAESYDDFSSSGNNFPPMGSAPQGGMNSVPSEFDIAPF